MFFRKPHLWLLCVTGGGAYFCYLKVGEEQVLFLHPSEADWSLIGGEYFCPQKYMIELALFLAPSNANENYVNVKPKSQ